MINKIKLIILLILIIIIGCEQPSKHIEISKEEGKIMSLLVDSMATSFPIPPPPPKDGSKPKPINIDSIRKVKVEVVIDTIMFPVSKHIEIDKEFSEYQNLIDSIPSLKAEPIEKKYVKSKRGHTLVFGNSLEDSNVKHSQIISTSRIAFNDKKNMAALYGGYSTHPLASHLNLYLLEKKNGIWKIVYKKNIEKS
ncbi:hypothetical protein [Zunongwangia profunda]|uniref:hypothetical protein n=1 Tax=Zunongwangia profunda TaxID=398743 RepID=UPI000C891DA1|nr:hypothetical protein [Zunongwangia profunda]MAG88152.1 hypothetical protein [Flavobacteriaceae bacterium]MCC4226712.1 hypothetical protein [Zunongwangia profunda]|tara:strand:- start:23 stop:607 length:585 start_codon:yes stop_codon:yes gene_type:complete